MTPARTPRSPPMYHGVGKTLEKHSVLHSQKSPHDLSNIKNDYLPTKRNIHDHFDVLGKAVCKGVAPMTECSEVGESDAQKRPLSI